MKKKTLASCISLFLITCISLSSFKPILNTDSWPWVKLDKVVEVQFPSQPSQREINHSSIYVVRQTDGIYMAITLDENSFPPGSMDKYPIKEEKNLNNFYEGLISSILKNFNGEISDSTSFYIGKYKGVSYSYISPLPTGGEIKRQSRAILVNKKVYTLTYTPSTAPTPSNQASVKRFLESIHLIDQ